MYVHALVLRLQERKPEIYILEEAHIPQHHNDASELLYSWTDMSSYW